MNVPDVAQLVAHYKVKQENGVILVSNITFELFTVTVFDP